MFYGKCVHEGDNSVNNPDIYSVEGNTRLSPGLRTLTTGIVLKIRFVFNPVP